MSFEVSVQRPTEDFNKNTVENLFTNTRGTHRENKRRKDYRS